MVRRQPSILGIAVPACASATLIVVVEAAGIEPASEIGRLRVFLPVKTIPPPYEKERPESHGPAVLTGRGFNR